MRAGVGSVMASQLHDKMHLVISRADGQRPSWGQVSGLQASVELDALHRGAEQPLASQRVRRTLLFLGRRRLR